MKTAKEAKRESFNSRRLSNGDVAILKGIEREIERSISSGELEAKFKTNLRRGFPSQIDVYSIQEILEYNGYEIHEASEQLNINDFSLQIKFHISWKEA